MRSVVLSGFLGTGKTTLGPLVASRLGLPFLDTDDEIARRAGASVAALWRAEGEGAFREREEALVRDLFADGVARVLAFGGGAVTSRAVRHLALDHALVVSLTAAPAVLLARVGDRAGRPILATRDPLARIRALLGQRADAYAECHLSLATDALSPDAAADQVAALSSRTRIAVPLGARTYPVDVVTGEPLVLAATLSALSPSSVLVVVDENVLAARGVALAAALGPLQVPTTRVVLSPGEEQKTLRSVEANPARRPSTGEPIAAPWSSGSAGAFVGDPAGFAASTLLRGVRVVQSPTSLLAMVDASVGGKTGFDLAEGKNLVGTFHQPSAVVADLAHLETLPRRELVSGLSEVVKVALACDEALWRDLEASAERLVTGDLATLAPIVHRAIERKARVVRDDEHEAGCASSSTWDTRLATRSRRPEGLRVTGTARPSPSASSSSAPSPSSSAWPAMASWSESAPCSRGSASRPTPRPARPAAAWPFVAHDKKRLGGSVSLPLPLRVGEASVVSVALGDIARTIVRRGESAG